MNREMILKLWASGQTAEQVAEHIDCSRDEVFRQLRLARMDCDPRAARRQYQAPARRRKMKIDILRQLKLSVPQIAAIVGVTTRMVQIRLKEMA